jgi:acetyl-CoA carboxylase biotin carboxyl carrier protein
VNFSEDDVNEILRLLDGVGLDEFELTTDRLRLELRRAGGGEWTRSTRVLDEPRIEGPGTDTDAAGADAMQTGAEDDLEGLLAVRAPLLGTFYRAPRPGADPYVQVGDEVEPDTVIGIIETMKLMNSVHAGVTGRVVAFRVENAEFAAKDAILLLVDPAIR